MQNEVMLLVSFVVAFFGAMAMFRIFGKQGLYLWTVFATIAANIEVMIVVEAFGLEQTLGNLLFASTFLITDIFSEIYGKKEAAKAVRVGVATSIAFIVVSQTWLFYEPAASDWAFPSITTLFTNTPRLMIAGFVVYAIVEAFDVWAYHKWWEFYEKRSGNHRAGLWLRNNGSTLISQFLNAVLFNLGAFWGTYDTPTLFTIVLSTYIIYVVAALLDTPFIYWARHMAEKYNLQ